MAPTNKIDDLFNVNGLVAVITGGGTGLGLYAARALDANGAKAVYIVGRREKVLQDAAKTGVNGTIKPVVGDVTDKESLKKIAEQVSQEHGYINLLFANAGVQGPKHVKQWNDHGGKTTVKEVQDLFFEPPMEDFSAAVNVNNTGVFYTAVAFLDLLDAGNKKNNVAQDSQILITSSVAGFSRHLNFSFAYSTSKAAVNHLAKMMTTFFCTHNIRIRVNIIAPGVYPSEMTENSTKHLQPLETNADHPGAFEGALQSSNFPAGRTGSEEDFAGTVLYMCSRAGSYLNGETLLTDGGRASLLPGTY